MFPSTGADGVQANPGISSCGRAGWPDLSHVSEMVAVGARVPNISRRVDRREDLAPRAVRRAREAVLQEILVVDVADRADAPVHGCPRRRGEGVVEREPLALVRDVRGRLERLGAVQIRVEHLVSRRARDRLPADQALRGGQLLRVVGVLPPHVEAERRAPRRHDLPVLRLPAHVRPEGVRLAGHPGQLVRDRERRDLQLRVAEEHGGVVEAAARRELEVVGASLRIDRRPGERRRARVVRLRQLVGPKQERAQPLRGGRCHVAPVAGRRTCARPQRARTRGRPPGRRSGASLPLQSAASA